MRTPPPYVRDFAERTMAWFAGLMHPEHFGLFRACGDAVVDWDLETSAKALEVIARLHGVEGLPRHSPEAVAATVACVRDLQDPDTGWFIDPSIESLAPPDLDPEERARLRQNKAKYGKILLQRLGSAPRRDFVTTGGSDAAAPDPAWVLERVRGGRDDMTWETRPNSVGNFACAYLRELFDLACAGQMRYLETVREGLEIVLAKQNPDTGLWGADPVPRPAQIQAALKIVGRLKWSFGMAVPHLERMADTCIAWHADGSFYAHEGGGVSHCDPRNAAEMVYVCLQDNPGYRGAELAATMHDICAYYERVHGTPDGAYSRGRGTEAVIYNRVALVAPATDTPRGDLGGTNGASYTFGMANHILQWGVDHLESPHIGWQARVASRPYRVTTGDDTSVRIEPQATAA